MLRLKGGVFLVKVGFGLGYGIGLCWVDVIKVGLIGVVF